MILFRPVGMHELRLIYEAAMRAFPPRLPDQPIFYPVLNQPYAEQIARDWNTRTPPWAGYVTRFDVDDEYAAQFERRVVGSRQHEELWVPAERLAEFNEQIRGAIEAVGAFFGAEFRGQSAQHSALAGMDAVEQLAMLAALRASGAATEFAREVQGNRVAVFLNYPFWARGDVASRGISAAERDAVLAEVRAAWGDGDPPLGVSV